MLENLERAKEAEANFEEDHFYIKENLNRELEVVLAEMDLLNSKLKILNEKRLLCTDPKKNVLSFFLSLVIDLGFLPFFFSTTLYPFF